MKICPLTGLPFEESPKESALREKLGVGPALLHPVGRAMTVNAFWQHWNLHKRICGKSGKPMVSVFPEDCPYPVWHKDEWLKHADPPGADLRSGEPVFPQMWEFFARSPIAHNINVGNENCEYADDWWYSRNCYLSQSGLECEDLRYCYRTYKVKDSQFCVFAFKSERCVDIVNCHDCFQVRYAVHCRQCSDSAFLFDCKNCTNCFMSANLRNKSYVFRNEQLTKEIYEKRIAEWDLRSREAYERAKAEFEEILLNRAWHRALFNERCENVTGDYLDQCKDCELCNFGELFQDCVNIFRGWTAKDTMDCNAAFNAERVYFSAMPQEQCYEVKLCADVIQCKYMEYSTHCFQCEHCFGCCGLANKKYHVFNKPYAPEEYERKKAEAVAAMQASGEYGRFFPGYFAAVPYEETLANFHWPLTRERAKAMGFRTREKDIERSADALDPSAIPDRSDAPGTDLPKRVFWDAEARRPFQIQQADIDYCAKLGVPLPNTQYARRLQENFRRIPCNAMPRQTTCGRCGTSVQTNWPEAYDGRILCEECYLKEVY